MTLALIAVIWVLLILAAAWVVHAALLFLGEVDEP